MRHFPQPYTDFFSGSMSSDDTASPSGPILMPWGLWRRRLVKAALAAVVVCVVGGDTLTDGGGYPLLFVWRLSGIARAGFPPPQKPPPQTPLNY